MIAGRTFAGLDKRRLRLALGLFFIALALPTALLVNKARGQLKWEAFHQHQAQAQELTNRIDRRLSMLVDEEEARSFADYGFLVVAGDPEAGFLQRSPLSDLPLRATLPGLLGYFQVDAEGIFSTPLLTDIPETALAYGINAAEQERRASLADALRQILSRNQLVDIEVRDQEQAEESRSEPATSDGWQGERLALDAPAGDRDDALPVSADPRKRDAAPRVASPAATRGENARAQVGFDRLELTEERASPKIDGAPTNILGRLEDLNLDMRYQRRIEQDEPAFAKVQKQQAPKERALRRERSLLPESVVTPAEPVRTEAKSEAELLAKQRPTGAPQRPRAAPTSMPPRQMKASSASQSSGATSKRQIVPAVRIRIFESELDPFSLSLLDSGHFVLYRKVWRDGQRTIQGALIEQTAFLTSLIEDAYLGTALSRTSDLAVAYRGAVLSALSARPGRYSLSSAKELSGALLYRGRLSAPADALELVFSINRLPAGPGAWVIGWLTAILGLVLVGGIYALYRLGLRQIALTRQQQDFVSSVSHELKTPLTSIRMYGEMLREGWATDERRQTYYAFICSESERLSRLINNVLQLARLTRNELDLDLKPAALSELMEHIMQKLASQVGPAGFMLSHDCSDIGAAVVRVDEDLLTQILINLVDNAVKFSRDAKRKEVRLTCSLSGTREVCLSIRDYGPGIPADQMKKIFRLFYRSGNELTRETMGTGIGLALVRQLTSAMHGRVDAVNADPGAEMRVFLPMS